MIEAVGVYPQRCMKASRRGAIVDTNRLLLPGRPHRTMIETVHHLKSAALSPPVCVGVHAVFADSAYDDLKAAGTQKVVTCGTIAHVSNAIDLTSLLAEKVGDLCNL